MLKQWLALHLSPADNSIPLIAALKAVTNWKYSIGILREKRADEQQ